jgi:perosamine synthetase
MSDSAAETVAFISSLYPHDHPVPLHAPRFFGREKEYLNQCIDSTFVSYAGEFVNKFEDALRSYTQSKYAIATVNGTTALFISLLSVGVAPADEVITQALTFVATANAISHCGADPVFIDVDRASLCLSPEKLEDFLKNQTIAEKGALLNRATRKKISAVVPVHIFGQPGDIDEFVIVCDRDGLPGGGDAAEALGGFYKERHVGTFGKIGILSFNGNKTISTGGGGMILTDDAEIARHIRHITTTAKIPHPYEFFHDEVGYNFRLPNLNAAIGFAQMEKIDFIIENKRETAARYGDFFSKTDIGFFRERQGCRANYWLNIIFLKDKQTRDAFLKYSNDHQVQTRPAWTLLNTLPMFSHCVCFSLDNSRALAETLVNIPSSVRV